MFFTSLRGHYRDVYWRGEAVSAAPFGQMLLFGAMLLLAISANLPVALLQGWNNFYQCYVVNHAIGIAEVKAVETQMIGGNIGNIEVLGSIVGNFGVREVSYTMKTAQGEVVGVLHLPAAEGFVGKAWQWLTKQLGHRFLGEMASGDWLLFTYDISAPHRHCLYISKAAIALALFLPTALFFLLIVLFVRAALRSRLMLWRMFRT